MNVLQKLRQIAGEVAKPGAPDESWALAGRLLARCGVAASRVEAVVAARDAAALVALVDEAEHPAAARAPEPAIDEDTLKAALRAFNKRLKLGRLADESRLGNRYVTGGRKSNIDAIIPPSDFPPEVWKALARAGRLKDVGQGFFAPASGPTPE